MFDTIAHRGDYGIGMLMQHTKNANQTTLTKKKITNVMQQTQFLLPQARLDNLLTPKRANDTSIQTGIAQSTPRLCTACAQALL